MQSRRTGRPSQVRPRPPSTGRPLPARARPVAPSTTRLAAHRGVERRRGLPLVAQALLVLAIVALGASVLWAGSGGVGVLVSGLAGVVGGVVDEVTATPTPRATPVAIVESPTVIPPEERYTRSESADVAVVVPPAVVGDPAYEVRLYIGLKDTPPELAAQVPVGRTSTVVLRDVPLSPGLNTVQATIVGPGGETDPSPVVEYVVDLSNPGITITSPTDGQVVNADTVTVTGKTQSRSAIVARNEANGATTTSDAAGDGTFEVAVPIAAGTNGITLTITDPAGNVSEETVSVRRGSGVLRAVLSGTAYRFRASSLPDDVRFTVAVTDPDGRPLPDALVLFTVTVPGLEAIVSAQLATAGDGTATFETRIAEGAMQGGGLVTVLVETQAYGTITDRQVLTIVE